jgi:hypothetical protein
MSNLVHNERVKFAATFWNNLGVAALLGVFLVPAFYTRHTMLQQALSTESGSRRGSACAWSRIGGCGGCGGEAVTENQLYPNRHSTCADGIAPDQHRHSITLPASASNFDGIPQCLGSPEVDHAPIILSVSARMTE